MSYDYRYDLGIGQRRGGSGGGLAEPTYVWLGNTLAAAPALSGVPAGSTYLNPTETTYVTRGGLKMRSNGGGTTAGNSGVFANAPFWVSASQFNAADFEVAAGTWQVGIIMSGAGLGGTLTMVDDPAGAANVRQSIALVGSANTLSDTDGTTYGTAGTAIAGVVAGMTLVPVTVSNLGSGVGVMRVYVQGGGPYLCAIALRQG
jgi:hypothetical protein